MAFFVVPPTSLGIAGAATQDLIASLPLMDVAFDDTLKKDQLNEHKANKNQSKQAKEAKKSLEQSRKAKARRRGRQMHRS